MFSINQLAAEIIDLSSLNNLIGGTAFIVNITVHHQGIAVSLRALIDTGAQAWLLADKNFCARLAQKWKLPYTTYDHGATVKGFQNKPIQRIDKSITTNLHLQGRRFPKMPFLVTDLGDRPDFQVIIGLRFLAYHRLLLDPRRRRLQFPPELPALKIWSPDITLPLSSLRIWHDQRAQLDMERRDRLQALHEPEVLVASVTPIVPKILKRLLSTSSS